MSLRTGKMCWVLLIWAHSQMNILCSQKNWVWKPILAVGTTKAAQFLCFWLFCFPRKRANRLKLAEKLPLGPILKMIGHLLLLGSFVRKIRLHQEKDHENDLSQSFFQGWLACIGEGTSQWTFSVELPEMLQQFFTSLSALVWFGCFLVFFRPFLIFLRSSLLGKLENRTCMICKEENRF